MRVCRGVAGRHPVLSVPFVLSLALCSLWSVAIADDGEQTSADAQATLSAVRALINERQYDEAELRLREALSRTEAVHGQDSIQAAGHLDLLVEILQRKGEWVGEEMSGLALRALTIKKKHLSPTDLDLVPSLINMAHALHENGDFAAAMPHYEQSLAIREQALGLEHPDVAESLYMLARLQKDAGRYKEALPLYERALAIREKSFGPQDSRVAQSLNGLGLVLRRLGELERAAVALERALAIREAALGPMAPAVAGSLYNLANLKRMMGDYAGARPLYERVLAIDESQPEVDLFDLAQSTTSVANLLFETDDYVAARPLYERALALMIQARGPDHLAVAAATRNLANLLTETGDFTQARRLHERALAIREKALGPQHVDVASSLTNLGELLRRMGDLAAAQPLLERGLAIREEALGPDHPDVARSLRYLAGLRRDLGDLAAARAGLERALGIVEQSFGPEHPLVAQDLTILAGVLQLEGEHALARGAFRRARDIYEKTAIDETHHAMALIGEARLLWVMGDHAGAVDLALRGETVARERFKQTASALSEREAFAHEADRSSGLDVAISIAIRSTADSVGSEVIARTWDEVIRSRSLVLDEMARRHRVIRSIDSDEIDPYWQAVVRAREKLSRLLVRGPRRDDRDAFLENVGVARAENEKAERALAARSVLFERELRLGQVGISEVAASLPKGSVLVAYVRYRRLESEENPSVGSSYAAMIQRAGESSPLAVPLGSAASIDELIRRWRRAVGSDPRSGDPDANEAAYRETGRLLREAIWEPVEDVTRASRQVFVVPDGAIHLVSLATLPGRGQRYLVETGPTLHYLSTERDLVREHEAHPQGTGLLALGGPDFDHSTRSAPGGGGEEPVTAILRTVAGTPTTPRAVFRSPPSACHELHSLKFEPLQSSRLEVDQIESLWLAASPPGDRSRAVVIKLTGGQAQESAFKNLAPGRSVVHVATHGFFMEGRCRSALRAPGDSRPDEPETGIPWGENPLRLSGLAMAGANHREEVGLAAAGEDGILTAEEIASLDLSGVEWVVLSACETGVGKVIAGEGVLGLRRAFEVAGARTLVMSLWSVDDDATRVWMRRLYESRTAGGAAAEAARAASLHIIDKQRSRNRTTHPYFWGAFVTTGDWR